MNEVAANKTAEEKQLENFNQRVTNCRCRVYEAVSLIKGVNIRLDGPEPEDDTKGADSAEPSTLFQKLNESVMYLEESANALEDVANRLHRIV